MSNGIVVDLCSDDEKETLFQAVNYKSSTDFNKQWHVTNFSALTEELISIDGRQVKEDKVTSIEEISRVRLTDLLFFFNNAPAEIFQSLTQNTDRFFGFYNKLVCFCINI